MNDDRRPPYTFAEAWARTPRAGKIFWIVVLTIVGLVVLSFAIWPDGSFPVYLWGF